MGRGEGLTWAVKRVALAVALAVATLIGGLGHPRSAAAAPVGRAVAGDATAGSVLARMNNARAAHSLHMLRRSAGLARAAAAHARSMAKNGYFSHSSPSGISPAARIRRYYHGSLVGETLVWRSPILTADGAISAWLDSAPHRAILLGARFRFAGISAVHVPDASGAYGGRAVTIIVADFGAP
jgi:uncharacterized protein YkwD